jgi:lipopolysaccharide cholinephosphotransferase
MRVLIIFLVVVFLALMTIREKFGASKPPLERVHQELYQALIVLDGIFRQGGLKYTISFGTLLGAVRHTDFIPWDDDADLIVEYRDKKRLESLIPHIQSAGYRYERLWKLHRVHTANSFIDIFLMEFDRDGISRRCQGDKRSCQPLDQEWWSKWWKFRPEDYYPFKLARLRNHYFPCPNKTMKMLHQWYGKNCLTECETHWWDHETSRVVKPRKIPCEKVRITYPKRFK